VTTDYREQEDGKWVDVWGWDSLFLNPVQYTGQVYPKPMYHLFEMISRLVGHRVQASRPSDSVNCFVSADPAQRKITMLVWNYGGRLGPEDLRTVPELTQVHVRDAGNFFHSPQVNIAAWQINQNTDNVYTMLTTGIQPDASNTAMAQLPPITAKVVQGALEFPLVLPPSSVSLVVLTQTQ